MINKVRDVDKLLAKTAAVFKAPEGWPAPDPTVARMATTSSSDTFGGDLGIESLAKPETS